MPISKGNKGRKNASIPSKFVVNLEERGKKSGFGTSSIRFNYLMQNESQNPGPGNYNLYKENIWNDNLASQSRKGYGGFASSASRKLGDEYQIFFNTGPGPGQYKLPATINPNKTVKTNELG